MMVWSNSVEELERVSVVADHLDQTGAEQLPVTSREIALVFAERLPLIRRELMLPASALLRVGWLLHMEEPPELRARVDARLNLCLFASLRRKRSELKPGRTARVAEEGLIASSQILDLGLFGGLDRWIHGGDDLNGMFCAGREDETH
jgi:hypothetical protein